MIYLVTKQKELFVDKAYTVIGVDESLSLLRKLKKIGFDTETEGLDPWTKQLLLAQFGCKDFQVVVDCRTIDIREYKELLESDDIEFLGWNLKFDLKFLYKHGIYPKNVYDGFLAEKLMWLGYPAGFHSLSLKSAGFNYCNVELDKSVRGKIIWSKTLTTDIIIYGANDVKYLETIQEAQLKLLAEKDLLRAVHVENNFVIPLAYCEFWGVKLDAEKWAAKMEKDNKREEEAKAACDKWLIENDPTCQYVYVDLQGDLFSGFSNEPKVSINWGSDKQVKPLFKRYGIDLMVPDKDNGGMKESIEAKVLEPQKDKCSLISLYLKLQEASKVTSTYGQKFLDQINPVSGRLHTNYQQMGADTTRITSGGKDKENNVEYINFLNLPSDAETRACFVAESGNKWISIDYSGQETYLMASMADDKAIINELVNGSGDIHSLTAYMSYKEIPRDTPIKEIKHKFHNLRQDAKGIEFAINYGGDANTISQNKGIPLAEAQKIYDSYMEGFEGLKKYQDFRRKDWWDKGYILLNEFTGHKAYIFDYELLKNIKERLTFDFYSIAKSYKGQQSFMNKAMKRRLAEQFANGEDMEYLSSLYGVADAYRQPISFFFSRKSDSEKQSINYPIQGSGSMCLRFSLIFFFKYLRDNNLLGKVKICIPPYDEINLEAPEEIAEEVAQAIYDCMVKGGSYFCTRCKLDADMSRLPDGTLPNYWIH